MNNIIERVWHQNKMVKIEDLRGMAFQAEAAGHTFVISGVDKDGNALALSGTVSGVFLRPDNTDVAITGAASGGVVSVTLPAECYDVPGRFGLTVYVSASGEKVAVYAAMGTVSRASSGTVSPGTVGNVVDLINRINAAVQTIPASWSGLMADIAPDYSDTAVYPAGAYVYYNGDLYRSTTAITTAETWTAAHWTAAALGNDVSDLKSALNGLEISEKYIPYNDGIKAGYAAAGNFPAIYRSGMIVKLNGAFGSSGPYFFRISGTVSKGTSATSTAGTPTVPLANGHTYCIGVKTLSGDLIVPDGGEFDIRLYDSVPSYHTTIPVGTETVVDWSDANAALMIRAVKSVSCANLVLLVYIRDCTEESSVLSRIDSLEAFDESADDLLTELEDRIVEQMPEECANLYSIYGTDYLTGKGFSGTTGDIVNSVNNVITGYIPVKAGDYYQIFVDGKNIFNTRIDGETRKVALYDSLKVWKSTAAYRTDNSNPDAIKAEADGFIRVMLRVNDNAPAIYVSSVLKKDRLIDLFVFAGQSNMAGRGVTSTAWPQTAPNVIPGAGYEFKSITDPTKLYPIAEPFGYAENAADDNSGIYDGTSKTGDMVPSFVNAYYKNNGGVPLVGVSASEGGSSSIEWQPETGNNFVDLAARVNTARTWLADNAYSIRHQYCVWCHGESDGDNINSGSETLDEYKARARAIFDGLIVLGMEKVLLVRIGHHNSGSSTRYKAIIDWQTDECKTNENLVLVSCDFAAMREQGMMKDAFHYYQNGYNITGHSAGVNSAFYATTGKEPTMYDPEYDNLYYSHK